MKDESIPMPIQVCSTKATFLVLQTKLDMKYFGTQKNGSLCETSLLSNIFQEATVLSRKTLEIHDRVANCLCFNGCKSTDKIEKCASEDAEEMLKHLETLKKLLKQIEAIESGVSDMKTHVPSKPLNPLSKSFVPSAKVYEQIEKYATNFGGNSLTTSCRMPLEAHAPVISVEPSTEQKAPAFKGMFNLSKVRDETTANSYCFNKKIRYLWPETKVVKTSNLSFVSHENNIDHQYRTVSNRQFVQPVDFTNIWSPTEQEKENLCKNNSTDICGFPSFTYFILKDIHEKPAAESMNSDSGGKIANGYHNDKNIKSDLNIHEGGNLSSMEIQEVDQVNFEDVIKSNGLSEKDNFVNAQKPLKSDLEKDSSVLKRNEQYQMNDTFTLLDERNESQMNVLKHLDENEPKIEKLTFGQVPLNFSVCKRPCSNWCNAKQTKSIPENDHEKNVTTVLSRQKNQAAGNFCLNNFESTAKIENFSCQQKIEPTILAAAFVKQTSTIFDTEQWNTWKLAEFRHRRDSGDSGYSSVGQSEHDVKLQQSHTALDIFGNSGDDFFNSRFENDCWTPLPDCKPKLPQNSCKRNSYFPIGHWDSNNYNRLKIRKGGNRAQNIEGNKDGAQAAPKFQRNLRSNKRQTWMMDLAVGK